MQTWKPMKNLIASTGMSSRWFSDLIMYLKESSNSKRRNLMI
jgi:hypothetical protein